MNASCGSLEIVWGIILFWDPYMNASRGSLTIVWGGVLFWDPHMRDDPISWGLYWGTLTCRHSHADVAVSINWGSFRKGFGPLLKGLWLK